MMLILKIFYWVSMILALYAFIGYPLLMFLVKKIKGESKNISDSQYFPDIEIIVAAYNEQAHIASTLKSLIAQNYPKEKIKITVFSDGSCDQTDTIVKTFQTQGVKLIRYEGRLGKTECQNRTLEKSRAEIIVFSDGNIFWQKNAVKNLVQPLKNQKIGCTTGALYLLNDNLQTEKNNEGLFRSLDHAIKEGESIIASCIGINGPIYALRRQNYIRLDKKQVSDLVLPILLAAQGKKICYLRQSQAFEPASLNLMTEYRRKHRLVIQGWVALPLILKALNPLRTPLLFILFFSHKLLRWLGVELLILAFILSILLAFSITFKIVLICEILLLFLALLGLWGKKAMPHFIQALGYFLLTNIASLVGTYNFIKGEKATYWKTQRP